MKPKLIESPYPTNILEEIHKAEEYVKLHNNEAVNKIKL